MKLILILFFSKQLLFTCVQNDVFVQQILSSDDFAPIAAGQNEVFYSYGSIFKEIRLPRNQQEQDSKERELLDEYESLSAFSQDFYVCGLSDLPNKCTFSYVQTDVVKLDQQLDDFKPFSGQKEEDFYCYQDRLIRHDFLSLDNNFQLNAQQVAHHQANSENFFKTYLLRMKRAEGDLFDMLLDERSQNWAWRIDMCYQIINIFKLFKEPKYNFRIKKNEYWHHLDIKPENILMQDFYTPLIGDLGNARKGSVLYDGSLKGTTAYLDPALITLKYFTEARTQQQQEKIDAMIQTRYNMADEYALGATILKVFMPYTDLDYDQETQYTNILEIAQSATSPEEKLIIKYLKYLMTNDLKDRVRIDQAEFYYLQFIVKMAKILQDKFQFGQYLEEQFDFYVDKQYSQTKPQFWKNYVKKIQMYQTLFQKNNLYTLGLSTFFNKFEKYQQNQINMKQKRNNIEYKQIENRPKSSLRIHQRIVPLRQRISFMKIFQKIQRGKRAKAVAKNRQEFDKNGLIQQFRIIGNKVNMEGKQRPQLKNQNKQINAIQNKAKNGQKLNKSQNKKSGQKLKIDMKNKAPGRVTGQNLQLDMQNKNQNRQTGQNLQINLQKARLINNFSKLKII